MEYVIIFIAIWLCIECLLWIVFKWLRSDFQWLIMGSDKRPDLDKKALEKFFKTGMDSELGWIRRPYTAGKEKGREGKTTRFSINKHGARHNPGYDEKKSRISLFGDSYAFGRQVDDSQTWSHLVSKELNENILNFGVGNYGLDQSIMRMEREKNNRESELYIILVVPETICRIQSAWKHYSEYGNTFAFKPRFVIKEGKLSLFSNKINKKEKYVNYVNYLDEIKSNDRFFKSKYLRDILTFPYVYSFFKSFKRNGPLVFSLICAKLSKNQKIIHNNLKLIIFIKIQEYLYVDESSRIVFRRKGFKLCFV